MGDDEGFFALESSGHDESGVLTAMLKTAADVVIDREAEAILSEGGLYAFKILAREIAEDGSFGDEATTDVTIVVTDQGRIQELLAILGFEKFISYELTEHSGVLMACC